MDMVDDMVLNKDKYVSVLEAEEEKLERKAHENEEHLIRLLEQERC